jgi:hypothetical protein
MRSTPKDVVAMRKAGMKVGAIACYMPKIRKWVLLRISVSVLMGQPIAKPGWVFPAHHVCMAQFAVETKTIRAKRIKGRGKGKRPYPKTKAVVQMGFRSEKQAYTNFLIRGDTLTWR